MRPLPSYQPGTRRRLAFDPRLRPIATPPLHLRKRLASTDAGLKPTVPLHDLQELDNDLRARADQDLALAALLCVVHGVERVVEHRCLDHVGGWRVEILWALGVRREVSEATIKVSLQEPSRA